jgi:hypothetical protein
VDVALHAKLDRASHRQERMSPENERWKRPACAVTYATYGSKCVWGFPRASRGGRASFALPSSRSP